MDPNTLSRISQIRMKDCLFLKADTCTAMCYLHSNFYINLLLKLCLYHACDTFIFQTFNLCIFLKFIATIKWTVAFLKQIPPLRKTYAYMSYFDFQYRHIAKGKQRQ